VGSTGPRITNEVAVVDADGQLVIKRRITDDADGFAELLGLLG